MPTEIMAAPDVTRTAPPAPGARHDRALTRRASLNVVQGLVDYSARLALVFLVTPILVRGLGPVLFGVWEMLQRLAGYLSGADGRPTAALRLVVASDQTNDDVHAKRRLVGGALVVWLLFLPLVAAGGAMLVWLAPMLADAGPGAIPAVRITCGLLVASFVVMTLAQVPEAVLRGENLGYRRMGLQAALHALGGVLMVAALAWGAGLVGLGAAQLVLWTVTGLCFWLITRRAVPCFGAARPRRGDVRLLLGTSAWLVAGDLIAKLLLASDVVIIGAIVGPAIVTPYVVTGYAARTALGVLVFAVDGTMPGLGGLLGAGERNRAAALRRELLSLTWMLVVALGGTILLWNPAFVRLWIDADSYAGFWVNLLLVVIALQTAFIRCDAYLIDAGLRPRARVQVGAAAAAVTIAAALALTPALGVAGACLGVVLGRAVQSVAFPMIVSRLLGRQAPSIRALIRPAALGAVLLAATAVGGRALHPAGWVAWGGGIAITAPLLALLAYRLGLERHDRAAVIARLRAIVRGLRG